MFQRSKPIWMALSTSFLLTLPAGVHAATTPSFGAHTEFNYTYDDKSEQSKDRSGDLKFERFAITVEGDAAPFDYSAEFTWYASWNTLMHAWIGYDFNEATRLQAGVTEVPFGNPNGTYNNWWGDVLWLTGFSVNKKTGIDLQHTWDNLDFNLALFKNDAFASGDNGRSYYYNLTGDNHNIGQLNARVNSKFEVSPDLNMQLGASGQVGRIQNVSGSNYNSIGTSTGMAVHLGMDYRGLGFMAQLTTYAYKPKDLAEKDTVQMHAYNSAAFLIPAEGLVYNLSLSYEPEFSMGSLNGLKFYNDFSVLKNSRKAKRASSINTLGFTVSIGDHLTLYSDMIWGKNMPGIGGISNLGQTLGPNDPQKYRFIYNLNLGLTV